MIGFWLDSQQSMDFHLFSSLRWVFSYILTKVLVVFYLFSYDVIRTNSLLCVLFKINKYIYYARVLFISIVVSKINKMKHNYHFFHV